MKIRKCCSHNFITFDCALQPRRMGSVGNMCRRRRCKHARWELTLLLMLLLVLLLMLLMFMLLMFILLMSMLLMAFMLLRRQMAGSHRDAVTMMAVRQGLKPAVLPKDERDIAKFMLH